jgi:hypothetical protein
MEIDNNISNINGGCFGSDVLVKYIKGELSGFEMNRVERHLATCEMCRDEYEGLSLLESPDKLRSIQEELNVRIDEFTEEKGKTIPAWGIYYRIAASLILLFGISSIVYITVLRNTPTNLVSKMEEFEIPAPEAIKQPNQALELMDMTKVEPIEQPKLDYSKSAGRSAKSKTSDLKSDSSVKFVAPVVVDSVTVDVAEFAMMDEAIVEVADSEKISKVEAFASGQAATSVNAPVKSENVENKKIIDSKELSEKVIVVGVSNRKAATSSYNLIKEEAINLYLSGKYYNALAILNKLNPDYQKVDTIQYYSSMCYYQLKLNVRSTSGLQLLSGNPKSVYFYDAQWYYALNLLRNGWNEQADSVLRSIVNVNPKYKEEAIKKLEWLKR